MRRAHEEVLDVVAVLHVHPGDADPAAVLHAVGRERQRLDVARLRDRDDHLLVGDQVLDVEVVLGGRDLRPALVAVGLRDLGELLIEDAVDAGLVPEDLAQLPDALDNVGVLCLDLVGLECGEALEAQVEDRLRLDPREAELLDQAVAGGVGIARATDQLDDRVEVVERDEQPLEDVRAGLLLAQLVLRAPHDHVALVVHVVVDDRAQRQRAGHVVDERDHVHAERGLHRRVLVELVQHDLGQGVALELDDEPHAVAVGLVPQVGDLGDLLVVHEVGDLLDEAAVAALLDHVGQLGDDDRLLAVRERLGVGAGPHADAAAAGLVGIADARHAQDRAAGREVGALDVAHEADRVDVVVLDVGGHGAGDLAQVVRRDVRRHADRDARRAVDEQVREPRRHDERLLPGAVVVGGEVDGVGVDVAEHLARHPGEPRLRVAHGGRRVVVHRAEVPLPVDERVAHGEVLRHAHERVVDGGVAVRVILAHHLADDLGALDRLGARPSSFIA